MQTPAGMTHQAQSGHPLRLPLYLNTSLKSAVAKKGRQDVRSLNTNSTMCMNPVAGRLVKKGFMQKQTQYMGNLKQRHFCLHLEMRSYPHGNLLSMTNYSANYHGRHL